MDIQTRGQLLAVFVESTFFNAELWCPDKEKGFKRLAKGFSRLLCHMVACDLEADEYNALCEAEIVTLTEHPPIKILMRCRRLRYLIGFIRAAPDVLWALVQAERNWGMQLWEEVDRCLKWGRAVGLFGGTTSRSTLESLLLLFVGQPKGTP